MNEQKGTARCPELEREFERQFQRGTRTVTFSPEHWAKLEQLAKARGKTPQECLEGFIETCKPGGSGWIHPSKTVVKEDDE